MRSPSRLVLAVVLLFTAACMRGATPVAPPPIPEIPAIPAIAAIPETARAEGKWNVALTAQGQAFEFVMELRPTMGNEFGGVVTSQMFPPMNINKATLVGNVMKLTLTTPTGDEGTFNLIFSGDTFSGDWSMPGDGSRVSGKRIP